MRRYKRKEVQDVYEEYIEHLKQHHPLDYDIYKQYLRKYA